MHNANKILERTFIEGTRSPVLLSHIKRFLDYIVDLFDKIILQVHFRHAGR